WFNPLIQPLNAEGQAGRQLVPFLVFSLTRPAGACGRWKVLCRGWDRPEWRTVEQIGEVAVMEQPQPVHPSDARTGLEEHEPEDGPADAWRLDCRAAGCCFGSPHIWLAFLPEIPGSIPSWILFVFSLCMCGHSGFSSHSPKACFIV
uniref:SCAN box domain-containing protein n=1 Tax=Oryzias latipes TaxID=8090 RepID=A0A3P9LKI8_ORYLA